MKTVAFIFSLIILSMALLPCTDVHADATHGNGVVAVADEHHSAEDMDLCSPFCFCNCCQTISIPVDFMAINFQYSHTKIDHFELQKQPIKQFRELWKPPKINTILGRA
ncbi:MAG TPA: DUF6660 family protein [Sunxiuqinia sp.]|nr:DUF6660 family protein [Sunxiuqinia sp.]